MTSESLARYDLTGPRGQQAVDEGLSGGAWFRSAIPRKRMKELMKRSDEHATKDTAIWLGSMALSGAVGAVAWWKGKKWAAVPALAAYGVLYGSASDSRWHEAGHGTFFATPRRNDVVYQIASFMQMRDPTVWRWSHTRHHTDTIVVGRDPEIISMRPPALGHIIANIFGLFDVPRAFKEMFIHASGRLTEPEATFVPETERRKVYWTARVWLLIYAATVLACIVSRSILPAMFVGLPRMYGAWHHIMTGLTQHSGLAEDVTD
ncbi:MAG: fatty acid desaturase, partial [Mycobacterium sp.]